MIMKKKYKERSARYRFWRNIAMILLGGIIGFLTGLVGSDHPIEFQKLFDREMLYIGSAILYLIIFGIVHLPSYSCHASLIGRWRRQRMMRRPTIMKVKREESMTWLRFSKAL